MEMFYLRYLFILFPSFQRFLILTNSIQACPFLVRVFCQEGRHHLMDEFKDHQTPEPEYQIHTWFVLNMVAKQ
jgi:hypothetical protein